MGRNSLLNIYSLLLSNWLNGGKYEKPGRMESTFIKPQYNTIYTKTSVKRVLKVTGIKPDGYDLAFIDFFRDRMFELNPDVELNINIDSHPVRVDVNNEKFSRAFQKASDAYQTYRDVFESQSGVARLTGKTYKLPGGGRLRLSRDRLDDLYQVYISYKYLFEHVSTGGTCCLVNIFFEVIGKDVRAVNRGVDDLFGLFGAYHIGAEIVKSANKAYYLEMGPAVPSAQKLNKKFLPQLLFTEENSAAFSSYKNRGLVGGGKNAILLGMDFRSRLPLTVDIFKSAGAQVFLLCGKTGSGKTYSAFQVALSALAHGHCVSAIDIKGREWVQLAAACTPRIITFDERHPSFVNTLRLDDMDLTLEKANEAFNTAVKGTVALFMLIINLQEDEGNPSDAELVVREAVLKMYSTRHVDPSNLASLSNTKGMKYADVLPILEELGATKSYTPEQKHMIHLARARLHAYFGESGMFADAFRNEISLGDIMNSNFVIYEFNKNQNAMTDSLDVVRIFMVQFLDSKKKAMLKEKGEFLFAFYEELQRCDQFGNLLEYICGEVTGSRSNNAVVFLLMNSLKILQGTRAQDIRSNITSFLVGLVEDNDIRSFEEDFNKPWLAHQLSLFASRQQIYRNCFCAVVDTGTDIFETVYKVQLPAELSRRFKTRTTLED